MVSNPVIYGPWTGHMHYNLSRITLLFVAKIKITTSDKDLNSTYGLTTIHENLINSVKKNGKKNEKNNEKIMQK